MKYEYNHELKAAIFTFRDGQVFRIPGLSMVMESFNEQVKKHIEAECDLRIAALKSDVERSFDKYLY
jgi:uncharacterized protein YktB (UPF0637 family)